MCEIASLIGAGLSLAATVAGSAIQAQGQERAAKQRQQTIAEEEQRQSTYRRAALESVDQAAEASARPAVDRTMADQSQRREENLNAATAAPAAPVAEGAGGNVLVNAGLGTQRARNAALFGRTNAALANMGGWSDALGMMGRTAQRSGESVAQQAGNARGQAGSLSARMLADGMAGRGLRMAGDAAIATGLLAPATAKYGSGGGWLSVLPSLTNWSGGGAKSVTGAI